MIKKVVPPYRANNTWVQRYRTNMIDCFTVDKAKQVTDKLNEGPVYNFDESVEKAETILDEISQKEQCKIVQDSAFETISAEGAYEYLESTIECLRDKIASGNDAEKNLHREQILFFTKAAEICKKAAGNKIE